MMIMMVVVMQRGLKVQTVLENRDGENKNSRK